MFPPAMPPSLSPMLILTMTMMTMSPLFPMLMSGTSAPRPRLPRPLHAGPGGEHETLDPALVLAPPDPEVTSLTPVEAPTVGHGPVPGPILRLPPSHDPDPVVAHQPPLAEVTEAVDSTPVHQQVSVDLHHSLDWTLGEYLVHDVLHPRVRPPHSVRWLTPIHVTRGLRPTGVHTRATVPGPVPPQHVPGRVHRATDAAQLTSPTVRTVQEAVTGQGHLTTSRYTGPVRQDRGCAV